MPATVVTAISSPLLMRGLSEVIREIPELQVVGQAHDAPTAYGVLHALRPELLVIDPEIARALRSYPRDAKAGPRVLMLGSQLHLGSNPPCGQRCACAFASDRADMEQLRSQLQQLARCPEPGPGASACRLCPSTESLSLPRLPLSDREYQVFEHIGAGSGNSAIAEALGVSVKTVETYRENIKRKLDLDSSHALLCSALKWREGGFAFEQPLAEGSRRSRGLA